MTAFYTDRTSARPGDKIAVHISSAASPCRLEVSRIAAEKKLVKTINDIQTIEHGTPPDSYTVGCGWAETCDLEIGADWPTGYYDLRLVDALGEEWHHFVCVRPAADAPRAKALIVLATNTYNAYNYWGGKSAYANVAALMSGTMPLGEAIADATGWLSTRRPYPQPIIAAPDDVPRLINLRPRGFEERPWGADPTWHLYAKATPYDGSAGYLNKWEHAFTAWAEGEGIALDYATDYDLEVDPDALAGYSCVLLVGHSEYWSGRERDALEAFVDGGGKLAIFSGNTGFWKVRYEDDGASFVCHKTRGFEVDPIAQNDPAQATHLWSHKAFGRPEAEITGLTFIFGGYHRLGMCVARGQAGYTVYNPDHWALDGSDLYYGDVFGGDIPMLGYENDGCRFRFGRDGIPHAETDLGVPENLEIIAIAPCAFGEVVDGKYHRIVPPEDLDVIARDVFDDPEYAHSPGILRGHAVLASFKRGAGEVFNSGTTEWAHALKAGDPFVSRITRNVLARFGAL